MAHRRLDGEPDTIADGFRCARPAGHDRRLVAARGGVGILLQALQNVRGGCLASRAAGWLVGLAWAAAKYFAVPVIALEAPGPLETLRRSARLVRGHWGEGAAGVTAVGGLVIVGIVPGCIGGGIGFAVLQDHPVLGAAFRRRRKRRGLFRRR